MSINMAWAALKSAVGAAPVAAAAATQVAAEQVPSTWDVPILHTHSSSISVFLHGEGSVQMYGSKGRFIHPEMCPGCDSFPSPNHPPLSVNVCDPVKFHPNVVCPCLPSTHFLAQCWCLYFRCLLLCVALPQWSLMCLWLRWYPGKIVSLPNIIWESELFAFQVPCWCSCGCCNFTAWTCGCPGFV